MHISSGISVVICCYNSATRLPATLRYLSNQKVADPKSVELIIVDNNSNDKSGLIALEVWKDLKSPFDLRVINEPRVGLSFARQNGFNSSSFEYIVLCDDDNWLEENYLQRACDIMQSYTLVGALGGRSTPVFEVTPPTWYDKVKASYAVGEQAEHSGQIPDSRGYLWGAGLVIRRAALEKLHEKGFQSILTDRRGKFITSGGDGEICTAIRLVGYTLYYSTNLNFQHYMTKERMTWSYYLKLVKSFGQARVYLGFYDYVISKNKSNGQFTPEEYWNNSWSLHKKTVFKSVIKLLRLWLRPVEGQWSLIDLQMKIGGFLEMLKVRNSYMRYIEKIDKTFSS